VDGLIRDPAVCGHERHEVAPLRIVLVIAKKSARGLERLLIAAPSDGLDALSEGLGGPEGAMRTAFLSRGHREECIGPQNHYIQAI
jgi:hypothetical protein